MFVCGLLAADSPLTEWEYLPPVGARPNKGFVGLKNEGATGYINSVLQQLFMISPIRAGILAVEWPADDVTEDDGAMTKGKHEEVIKSLVNG